MTADIHRLFPPPPPQPVTYPHAGNVRLAEDRELYFYREGDRYLCLGVNAHRNIFRVKIDLNSGQHFFDAYPHVLEEEPQPPQIETRKWWQLWRRFAALKEQGGA